MAEIQFWVSTVIQVLSLVVVVATLVIYSRQLLAMQRQIQTTEATSSNQMFFELVRYLDGVTNDRKMILEEIERRKAYGDWATSAKDAAPRVCASFNLAGILTRQNMVPRKLMLEAWSYSAPTCYDALKPYLLECRQKRGEGYWGDFDWLVAEIRAAHKAG